MRFDAGTGFCEAFATDVLLAGVLFAEVLFAEVLPAFCDTAEPP